MTTWSGGAPATFGAWLNSGWNSAYHYLNENYTGGSLRSGMQWTGVTIPQGATITSATLTFSIDKSTTSTSVGIHAVDNAPAPASAQQTTAFTATAATFSSGTGSKTVDLTAAMQALVSRPGWASGNAFTVRLQGQSASSGYATISSPTLTVTYANLVPVSLTGPVAVKPTLTVGVRRAVILTAPVAVKPSLTVVTLPHGHVILTAPVALKPTLTVRVRRAVILTAPAAVKPTVTVHQRHAVSSTGSDEWGDTWSDTWGSGGGLRAPIALNPALVATVIPPLPWQTLITTTEFAAAMSMPYRTSDWRAEIITPDGVVLTDPLPFEGGQVVVDGTRAFLWSMTMKVFDPAWWPRHDLDPLHPYSRCTVQLWWRLQLPKTGQWVEIPCGRYYPRVPALVRNGDDPPEGFDLTGVSGLGTIRSYLQPIDVSQMRAHTAIDTILSNVAPSLPRDLTPSMYSLPAEHILGKPFDGDPVQDMHGIAADAGMILYEDRTGVVRLDPIPDAIPDYDWTQQVVQAVSVHAVDISKTVNALLVTSTSQDVDPPVSAIAQIADPDDAISTGFGFYYTENLTSDTATTEDQVGAIAHDELMKAREQPTQVDLVVLPQPHVDMSRVVALDMPAEDVVGAFRVTGWSMDLDPTAMQAVLAQRAVGA